MPKHGRALKELIPQFPADVSQKLAQNFSVTTVEEFLGLAATQTPWFFAQKLDLPVPVLKHAIEVARKNVDRAFLRELDRPVEHHNTGALIDHSFKLPAELARHLQRG